MRRFQLRVDANVSVHRPGEPLGVRTEVKNINSVRYLARAIDYEIRRQTDVVRRGGSVRNETRACDPKSGTTVAMRDKEVYEDPSRIPSGADVRQAVVVQSLRAKLPELPGVRRDRLVETYDILPEHSFTLLNEEGLVEYFESVLKATSREPRKVIGWVTNELLAFLKQQDLNVSQSHVSPSSMAQLLELLEAGSNSSSVAKQVFQEMWRCSGAKTAAQIIHEQDLSLISDMEQVRVICAKVLDSHPHEVQAFRAGKKKVLNKLMGSVQKETKGRADPVAVRKILQAKISETV
ncbi:glutamyl-tRNA(Gln) amidotransferase subunit B, mitochondrial-like [Phyllopteryx taeniolatus]|uniref:glutamyl-tRNA(Gln) amidotransferase subunit B, mitochondrial-like n=1 Tax=Phyllopteryx taeniolatus TaxID=161469 RepID=UPI002AD33EFC|nr:glutamyl-tRNA(Gln) amidotransferase subunit B, mitochondrial-like [Phyllopteryx taeniolatus]